MRLTFFTKPDCHLCESAWFVINKVARRFSVPIDRVDISAPGAEEWFERYEHDIPVVHLNGEEVFRHHVAEGRLRDLLAHAPRRF